MDLVAITDHDSINGALELLARRPDADDVIVGEEVSCWFPGGGIEVHLGVYDMTEALHRELQPLRRNVFDVTACLRSAGVFFSLNHLLHFYRGQVPLRRLSAPARRGAGTRSAQRHDAAGPQRADRGACRAWPASSGAALGVDRRQRRAYAAPHRPHLDDGTRPRRATEFMASLRARARSAGWRTRRRDGGRRRCLWRGRRATSPRWLASARAIIARWRRAGCLAFGVVSLPFQFMPLVVARWLARPASGARSPAPCCRRAAAGPASAQPP